MCHVASSLKGRLASHTCPLGDDLLLIVPFPVDRVHEGMQKLKMTLEIVPRLDGQTAAFPFLTITLYVDVPAVDRKLRSFPIPNLMVVIVKSGWKMSVGILALSHSLKFSLLPATVLLSVWTWKSLNLLLPSWVGFFFQPHHTCQSHKRERTI